MKKLIYALILPMVVISGVVFANCETKSDTTEKPAAKPLSAAEMSAGRKQWEATPDGIRFKQWEASPAGVKVLGGAAKIRKHATAGTGMEAVITSLSLPPGSSLGFGVMARIDGEEYILSFGPLKPNEMQQLQSLKVNDKIIVKSRGASVAPKYAYAIVAGDYIERDGKIIYKRVPPKGGC